MTEPDSPDPTRPAAFARRRTWGLASAIVAFLLLATPITPAHAQLLPSVIQEWHLSATAGAPGAIITFTGTCLRNGVPAEEAYADLRPLRPYRPPDPTSAETAHELPMIIATFPVSATGDFAGQITLDPTSPPGDYRFVQLCFLGDTGLGHRETAFTVTTPATPAGSQAELTATPTSAAPGTAITITGLCRFGTEPATTVHTRLAPFHQVAPTQQASLPVTPDGRINTTITVDPGAPPDDYRLGLSCDHNGTIYGVHETTITITAPLPPPTTVPTATTTTTTTAAAVRGANIARPVTATPNVTG